MYIAKTIGILSVCLTFLAGCTKPYQQPVIEEPPLASAQPFPGFKNFLSDGAPLRIFWTHGMCRHDFGWVQNRSSILRAALGAPPEAALAPSSVAERQAYTVRQTFEVSGKAVDVSFFIWSPMTTAYKDALIFDAPSNQAGPPRGDLPYERASLNNALKVGLMNDCLVDAVVYSGTNGDPIRLSMRQALCSALGGRLEPPAYCNLSGSKQDGPVLFVTESIGSKFLFDAVRALWNAAQTKDAEAKSTNAQAKLAEQLAQVQMVYMVANQIPILDQANPVGGFGPSGFATQQSPRASSLADFATIVSEARSKAPQKAAAASASKLSPLTVVAFSDPSDILTYRLLPSGVGVSGGRLVNVIVSNDWTYFGTVERPDNAHCGYGWNPQVIGLLAEGHDGTGKIPTGPVSKEGACLE